MENNPNIDYEELKSETKILKVLYILHMIMYILIIFSHILLFLRTLWLSYIIMVVFFLCSLLFLTGLIIPFIFVIYLVIKKINKKLIKTFIIISKILFFFCIINTAIIITIIFLNSKSMYYFYEDCPFNFYSSDMSEVFNNYTLSDVNIQYKQCNNRRCLFSNPDNNTLDDFYYNYICNFYTKKQDDFNCSILDTVSDKISEEIQSYVNFCQYNTTFYKCLKSSGYYFYNITADYSCPDKSDVIFGYLIGFFFFIIDILGASTTWLMEYYSYKKIILILSGVRVRSRFQPNNPSQNETNNTSKIEERNEQNNNRNDQENQNNNQNENQNEESFVKQETEIMIIDNGNNINNDNNLNMIINKEQKNDISSEEKEGNNDNINKIQISNKDVINNSKNDKIITNDISAASQSGNLLLNNNKDYFKEANVKAENQAELFDNKEKKP